MIIKSAVLICIMGILIFPQDVVLSGREAVELSLFRVLPSLFPFFVLQNLCVNMGIFQFLTKIKLLRRIFKTNDISPFILGIIGGYPVGAKTVMQMYENKIYSKETAERMLAFCNNAGPAFIVAFVGGTVFQSARIGYILLASHIISAIILGILVSFKEKEDIQVLNTKTSQISFTKNFINSVNTGFSSSLAVSGYIIFFNVLVKILDKFNVFYTIGNIINPMLICFSITNVNSILIGFIEMTTGVNYLADINMPMEIKLMQASFILGFGGMSIHFQTLNFNTNLKTKKYFFAKTLHGFMSAVITYLIFKSGYVEVWAQSTNYDGSLFFVYNFILLIVLVLLIVCKKSN